MNKDEIWVYLDETHHLPNNESPMVLGAIWGTPEDLRTFSRKIKVLRAKHDIPTNRELKWTKVSPAKLQYYLDINKTFLTDNKINYRAVIVDKSLINNVAFHQTDDDFYYKIQYLVIRNIAERHIANFRLFFDYKDTQSSYRCKRTVSFLKAALSSSDDKRFINDTYDAQPIRSHEAIPLQVVDFLNGLIAFANVKNTSLRKTSKSKRRIVDDFKKTSGLNISVNTPYAMDKVNLLFWRPKQ